MMRFNSCVRLFRRPIKQWLVVLVLLVFGGMLNAQKLLSLDMALKEAMQNSPEIRQSLLSLTRDKENLTAQRASLKSNFKLGVNPLSYSKTRTYNAPLGRWIDTESTSSSANFSIEQPIIWTDGVISLKDNFRWQDSYSSNQNSSPFTGFDNALTLSLQQPIFTYNRTKLDLKELELAYENSTLNYSLKQLDVEKRVSQLFYNVYQATTTLNISKEEYKNRTETYEIIKNKVEGGLQAKEELYQAELDLLSSKSEVQNNEVELENRKDQFKQLVGIPLMEQVAVIADVAVTPVDVDLAMAIQKGLSSRMELRQREIEIQNSHFSLIKTNARNEFKGNISVDVGLVGKNEEFGRVYDDPSDNQDFSVSLEIPLWDWGEKKARMRAAEAALQSSQYNLEDEETGIVLTVRQVHRSLQNLLVQIEIARKNVENANLTYEINLEKYRNGDLTSMDLNLVQNQLTQKKSNLTRALINYKLELLNMKIQTMWDFENNSAVAPEIFSHNNN